MIMINETNQNQRPEKPENGFYGVLTHATHA